MRFLISYSYTFLKVWVIEIQTRLKVIVNVKIKLLSIPTNLILRLLDGTTSICLITGGTLFYFTSVRPYMCHNKPISKIRRERDQNSTKSSFCSQTSTQSQKSQK